VSDKKIRAARSEAFIQRFDAKWRAETVRTAKSLGLDPDEYHKKVMSHIRKVAVGNMSEETLQEIREGKRDGITWQDIEDIRAGKR
jgi:hypothetical protein